MSEYYEECDGARICSLGVVDCKSKQFSDISKQRAISI
jgi:hypothetical protein